MELLKAMRLENQALAARVEQLEKGNGSHEEADWTNFMSQYGERRRSSSVPRSSSSTTRSQSYYGGGVDTSWSGWTGSSSAGPKEKAEGKRATSDPSTPKTPRKSDGTTVTPRGGTTDSYRLRASGWSATVVTEEDIDKALTAGAKSLVTFLADGKEGESFWAEFCRGKNFQLTTVRIAASREEEELGERDVLSS